MQFCHSLEKLTLPPELDFIGMYAFGFTAIPSIVLPEGTLRDGMNMIQFRQTVPASGTEWTFYEHWGMTLVPPPRAFYMIVR